MLVSLFVSCACTLRALTRSTLPTSVSPQEMTSVPNVCPFRTGAETVCGSSARTLNDSLSETGCQKLSAATADTLCPSTLTLP